MTNPPTPEAEIQRLINHVEHYSAGLLQCILHYLDTAEGSNVNKTRYSTKALFEDDFPKLIGYIRTQEARIKELEDIIKEGIRLLPMTKRRMKSLPEDVITRQLQNISRCGNTKCDTEKSVLIFRHESMRGVLHDIAYGVEYPGCTPFDPQAHAKEFIECDPALI
jgi:hypothetical protein